MVNGVPLACRYNVKCRRRTQVMKKVADLTKAGIKCKVGRSQDGFPIVKLAPNKKKRVVISRRTSVRIRSSPVRTASRGARIAIADYVVENQLWQDYVHGGHDARDDGNMTDHSGINPSYEYASDDSN